MRQWLSAVMPTGKMELWSGLPRPLKRPVGTAVVSIDGAVGACYMAA